MTYINDRILLEDESCEPPQILANYSSTVYFVTGANRQKGIGFALVAHILATHENAFVYAGTRDPENSIALQDISYEFPGRLSIVKCVYGDAQGNTDIANEIEERHGRLDTVVANAGVLGVFGLVHEIPASEMEKGFQVNVIGHVVLFQSVYSLLKKSAQPRFVAMSSIAASLNGGIVETKVGAVTHGSSKAALNWVTRKIHFENDWLVSFPLDPGVVATDILMESSNNDPTGMIKKRFLTGLEPSAAEAAVPLLKIIDESNREKDGGKFVSIDGTIVQW